MPQHSFGGRQLLAAAIVLLLAAGGARAEDPGRKELERKLAMPIDLEKGIDKDTPLKDVLEFLSDRYDLKYKVDDDAFKKAGIKDWESVPIKLAPQRKLPLGTVLQRILQQVPAYYRIEGKVIVIAPASKIA